MKNYKEIMLKTAGVFAMLVGLLLMFGGFYYLSIFLAPENIYNPNYQNQIVTMKVLTAYSFYVMVFGIVNCVAGFIGFVNADEADNNVKCRNYGIVLFVMSIVNAVGMAVFCNLSVFVIAAIIVVCLLADTVYMVAAILKMKDKQ